MARDPLKIEGDAPDSYFLDPTDPSAGDMLGTKTLPEGMTWPEYYDSYVRPVEYEGDEDSYEIDQYTDKSKAPSMNNDPLLKDYRIVPNHLIPGVGGNGYSIIHKQHPAFVENDPRLFRDQKDTIIRDRPANATQIHSIEDPQILYDFFIYDRKMDPNQVTPEMLYPLVEGGPEVVDEFFATADVKTDNLTQQPMLVPRGTGTSQEDYRSNTGEDYEAASEGDQSMEEFFADLTEYLNSLSSGEDGPKGVKDSAASSGEGVLTSPAATTVTPTSELGYVPPDTPVSYTGGYSPDMVPEITRGSGKVYMPGYTPPPQPTPGELTDEDARELLGFGPGAGPSTGPDDPNLPPDDPIVDPDDPTVDPDDPTVDPNDPNNPNNQNWDMGGYLFSDDEYADWLRQQAVNQYTGKSYDELSDLLYNDQPFLEWLESQGGDDWEQQYFGFEDGAPGTGEFEGFINIDYLRRQFLTNGSDYDQIGLNGLGRYTGLWQVLQKINDKYGGVPVEILKPGSRLRQEMLDTWREDFPEDLWNFNSIPGSNGPEALLDGWWEMWTNPNYRDALPELWTDQEDAYNPDYRFGYGTNEDYGTMVYDPATDTYTPWAQMDSREQAEQAMALSQNWNPPPWEQGHNPNLDIYGNTLVDGDGISWHQFLALNGIEYDTTTGGYNIPEEYDWTKPFTYDNLVDWQEISPDLQRFGLDESIRETSPEDQLESPSSSADQSFENRFFNRLTDFAEEVPGIAPGAIPATEIEGGKGAPQKSAGKRLTPGQPEEEQAVATPLSGGLSAPVVTNGYGTRRRGLFVRNI